MCGEKKLQPCFGVLYAPDLRLRKVRAGYSIFTQVAGWQSSCQGALGERRKRGSENRIMQTEARASLRIPEGPRFYFWMSRLLS